MHVLLVATKFSIVKINQSSYNVGLKNNQDLHKLHNSKYIYLYQQNNFVVIFIYSVTVLDVHDNIVLRPVQHLTLP